MQQNIQQDSWKHSAGVAAAQLIEDGMVIGLGSGSTAVHLIYALAERIQNGLRIVGAVPSSKATEDLAGNLGIPLTTLDAHPLLDLDIDGADEIDSQLNLIKGGGGALLREKIVAFSARRFVVIADNSKLVPMLGQHFALPVEVIPFAIAPVRRHLAELGASTQVRTLAGQPYITDNGNMIVDCTFSGGIPNPLEIHTRMKSIVGLVETGLFLNMTEQAIIGGPEGVKVLTPSSNRQA
ncbi:MAG TPA: ribose-5-phosphate isomerase RpiA [Ktedonobacteraceae bacterium]|nr:ribose-5-phosphate isomerase RpiA [Ktedonobacteraceae bacterium]